MNDAWINLVKGKIVPQLIGEFKPEKLIRFGRICYTTKYMIKSFKNAATEDIFNGINSKAARKLCPPELWKIAARKLDLLDAAESLNDLRVPPGNRLEALKGDRTAQYSIRINDRYRICFVWREGNAEEIEIVDYHQ